MLVFDRTVEDSNLFFTFSNSLSVIEESFNSSIISITAFSALEISVPLISFPFRMTSPGSMSDVIYAFISLKRFFSLTSLL